MRIFIPSFGRPDRQKTAAALAEAGVPFEIIHSERDKTIGQYPREYKSTILVGPRLLVEKRDMLFQMAKGKIVMMDDDLTFFSRKRDGSFTKATPAGIRKMVKEIESRLDLYAHVGLVDKFMAQSQPRRVRIGGRYNQVLAYNLQTIRKQAKKRRKEVPSFRMALNQEHDMHLQLLALGLPPAVLCEYSKDAKYYAEGGLSNYRTAKTERDAFRALAKKWPKYVTLVETKNSISGMAARFDWRAARVDGEQS